MLIILGIVILIYLIWAVIWRALFLPIKQKDELLKEREAAKEDLLQIQAAKAVEWDKYKELQEETDKLRKAHFSEKERNEKLREDNAKLQVHNDNLKTINKQLKDQPEVKK